MVIHPIIGDPPSALGERGDFAFDTRDKKIFGPKGPASWPTGIALVDLTSFLAPLALATLIADGAITIPTAPARGVVVLAKAASAIAATLAAPSAAQDGTVIYLTAGTAKAHVVTATGLVQDGVTGGAKDTLTFAAFVGASAIIVAISQKWHVLALNAVTVA